MSATSLEGSGELVPETGARDRQWEGGVERPVDGHCILEGGRANFNVHQSTVEPMDLGRDILRVSTTAFGLRSGSWLWWGVAEGRFVPSSPPFLCWSPHAVGGGGCRDLPPPPLLST